MNAASSAVRGLADPASASATVLLIKLRLFGLYASTSVWLQPVPGVTGTPPPLAPATLPPPRPPPRPPFAPARPAPPGALGGFGGAKNRHRAEAGSAGAAVGYAIAAVVILWLPMYMAFHALTAAHVRRTSVCFAVALQCEAALARGVTDLHASFGDRASRRLSQADEAGAEGAERFVLKGRRFAAQGLADAAVAFFQNEARGLAAVRPLLRTPLLAALGGAAKKQDPAALAARRKPKGAWKRLKRALHAELAWHKRAAHHAARSLKRCFTPRFSAEARAAGHGAGHAFRLVPAGDWLADAAPGTAALFEVSIEFGFWRGRAAAAAFRAQLRDGARLRHLETAFAAAVAALDAAPPAKQQPLGIRNAGAALLALLDDEPFARLDSKLSCKVAGAEADATASGASELGLSAPVAQRLAVLLLLCLKEKEATARRASMLLQGSPTRAVGLAQRADAAGGCGGGVRRGAGGCSAAGQCSWHHYGPSQRCRRRGRRQRRVKRTATPHVHA